MYVVSRNCNSASKLIGSHRNLMNITYRGIIKVGKRK